jgi:hypothetical protein
MKDVYSPPRARPHTDGEVKQFHQVRDHEAGLVKSLVTAAVGTLGAPGIWGDVLKVVAPIAVDVGSWFAKALHPESPGGAKLTHDELEHLAYRAARQVERALLQEFAHLAVPNDLVTADGPIAVATDGGEAVLAHIAANNPPESTLDPGPAPPPPEAA